MHILRFLTVLSLFLLPLRVVAETAPAPTAKAATSPAGQAHGLVIGVVVDNDNLDTQALRNGIELASKRPNETPVSVTVKLVERSVEGVTTGFKALVQDTKVRALITLVDSSVAQTLYTLANTYTTPTIAASNVDGQIPSYNKYVFSIYPKADLARGAVERFFVAHPEIHSVDIICSNSRLGTAYAAVWRDVAETRGVKIIDQQCGTEQTFDFRINMIRIKNQNPDAFLVGFGLPTLLGRMVDLGMKGKVLSTSEIANKAQRGEIKPGEGITVFFDAPVLGADFAQSYRTAYGTEPTMIASLGYEAMISLMKAEGLHQPTLRSGLDQLKYEGVSGEINFTGDAAANASQSALMQVVGTGSERVN